MLIIKIIVLLWVITGTLLGVGFCYSDKSDGYFDGLDNFTLIVTIVLSPMERERIIQRSVEREHWKTKSTICMEEMAELQQQISKQIRGYDDRYGLLEEMADVYISLKLLESIFNVTPEEMQKAIDVKLARERSNQ